VILLLYVDDVVRTAAGSDLIDWIRNRLEQEFDMTDLGVFRSIHRLEI